MPEIKGTHSAEIEREQRGYQWIRSGIPGNVAPPPQIKNWSITQQEQPDHPRPYVLRGVAIPNVAAPPQIGAAKTVQEWPDERQAFVRPGIQGPNVAAPPQIGSIVVRQEQPDHPNPFIGATLSGPVTVAPGTRQVITAQEQPFHPLPGTLIGIQGPNVAPPSIKSWSVTVQEAPDERQAFVRGSLVLPPIIAIPQGRAITIQEQPDHPLPRLLRGVSIPNPPPVTLLLRPLMGIGI